MKNFNYIFSAAGWVGFGLCLIIIIYMDKCGKASQTIRKETVINNYYDTGIRLVPQIKILPGQIIPMPVPVDVDTEKILALYFSKFPFKRVFENDTIAATLLDTISKNNFIVPGKFSYKWKIPIRTVQSTTTTVTSEEQKKIKFLVGAYAQIGKGIIKGYGPEIYLQGKKGNLYGANYDLMTKEISIKTAINLNEVFRNKRK